MSFHSYLKIEKGAGTIDFHPEVYYTDKPEKVLHDIRVMITEARSLRLNRCKLIIGKGNSWRPGGTGTLMGYVKKMIEAPRIKPHIHRAELVDEGACLLLEFSWHRQSNTHRYQENMARQKQIKQQKLDKARERANRVRLSDGLNSYRKEDFKKSTQKIKAVISDYFPDTPKSNDPADHLITFLAEPDAIPDKLRSDLERLIWQLWFQMLFDAPDLFEQKQQLGRLVQSQERFSELEPLLDDIENETDLKALLRLMLPHLPANVVRL